MVACGGEETYVPKEPDPDAVGKGGDDDGQLCSKDSGVVANLHIEVAAGAGPYSIWWVNRSCVEQDFGQLDGGQQRDQATQLGHVWRIKDAAQGVVREIEMTLTSQSVSLP